MEIKIDSCTYPIYTFPKPTVLAGLTENELRSCGMGFRAPYLLEAAQAVSQGRLHFDLLSTLPLEEARECLMQLPGVGQKIADCVLLFSLGKKDAFPMDTWILKVLRQIYFSQKRCVKSSQLRSFATHYFGPQSGLAQQYLFHYARMNPIFLQTG